MSDSQRLWTKGADQFHAVGDPTTPGAWRPEQSGEPLRHAVVGDSSSPYCPQCQSLVGTCEVIRYTPGLADRGPGSACASSNHVVASPPAAGNPTAASASTSRIPGCLLPRQRGESSGQQDRGADGRRAGSGGPADGGTWPVRRGTAPGRLGVANDIKPGVSNGHGHTEPSTVAEDRHAINAIARHPQSPDLAANVKPEDAASGARPWPSVKHPTVRRTVFGHQSRPLCVRGQRDTPARSATR